MTKDEIVRKFEDACGHGGMVTEQLRYVTDAVAALDVCTPAEREFIEARMALRRLPYGTDPVFASDVFQRFVNAEEAVVAERTPPDPLEAFVAKVKAAEQIGYAIAKLDAARGRK